MTFTQWMHEVNRLLRPLLGGMDSRDIGDRCWRDAFDDALEPSEAIEDLIGDPNDPNFMRNAVFG